MLFVSHFTWVMECFDTWYLGHTCRFVIGATYIKTIKVKHYLIARIFVPRLLCFSCLHVITGSNLCNPLLDPGNGKYLPDVEATVGMVLITVCNTGYHPSLNHIVMCTAGDGDDGVRWFPPPPVCCKLSISFTQPISKTLHTFSLCSILCGFQHKRRGSSNRHHLVSSCICLCTPMIRWCSWFLFFLRLKHTPNARWELLANQLAWNISTIMLRACWLANAGR